MDNAVLKALISKHVNATVDFASLPGLHIEAFSWEDYTFSIHTVPLGVGKGFYLYLFKDTDELFYIELPVGTQLDSQALFDHVIVPNVPAYVDHVAINDNSSTFYMGGGVWGVNVVEHCPIEETYDLIFGSYFITDELRDMDNQDTSGFIGLEQFNEELDSLDMDGFEDAIDARRQLEKMVNYVESEWAL